MKKFLSAALAMTMLTGLFAFSASAAAPISDVSRMSTEQIAYLDIDRATPEVQEAILAARSEIIFGDQGWTVNGAVRLLDQNTGTVTELPEFSELFPGWDLPEASRRAASNTTCTAVVAPILDAVVSASDEFLTEHFVKGLKLATSFAASPDFFDFNGTGDDVAAFAATGPADFKYNIGFSNTSRDEEVGWVPNMKEGQGAIISTKTYIHYGVRASAANKASVGQYYLYVTNDPSLYGDYTTYPVG